MSVGGSSFGRRVRRAFTLLGGILVAYLLVTYVVLPLFWREDETHRQPGPKDPPASEGVPKVTRNREGIPGDPLNVGLVGNKSELVHAMAAVGWQPADPLTLKSSREIARSVVFGRPDLDAPVSPLYVWGRKQDFAFEQEVGSSADKRHHVRWWYDEEREVEGRPFWIGDASFDVGVELSRRTGEVTHHIDPDLDAQRDQLMDDLEKAGQLVRRYQVPGVGPTQDGRNAGGDRYFTDGMMAIGVLKPLPAEPSQENGEQPSAGAEPTRTDPSKQ